MAFGAGVPALILDRKILPFLNIAETVKTVGEVSAMNAEIIWYQKLPRDED